MLPRMSDRLPDDDWRASAQAAAWETEWALHALRRMPPHDIMRLCGRRTT
jgi:hypothetical protein